MQGIVSPYELQPLSPGAAAALTLCDTVVTLLPTPDTADLTAAQHHAPRFRQLLDAWSWSTPLWRSSLLRPTHDAQSPIDDIRESCRRILASPRLAPLAPLISATRFDDPAEYLDAICRDILRGGADPAITIPVTAGLEAFAARHHLISFTTPAASVSGRLESRAARPFFKLQLPLLTTASAAAFEHLRHHLEAPIAALRRLIAALHAQPAAALPPAAIESLNQAQDAYTTAFSAILEPLTILARRADRDAKVGLFASLTCVALDPEASLLAAARAAQSLSAQRQAPPAQPPAAALAPRATLAFHVRALPWDLPRVP